MTEKERLNFEKQKEDAEKRLNEMYYNSGKKDPSKGLKVPSFIATQSTHNAPQNHYEKPAPKVEKTTTPRVSGILNMLNFKGIEMDNDRLLILAVCLLLLGDSDDELLMLALIYVML